MSKATIWTYLKQQGLSDIAVAGIMGNMEAESNCEACRVQGDFSSTRTLSKIYAEQFNTYPQQCFRDAKGWGLCQWTFYTRKEDLWNFCHDRNTGVEDETAQLAFFIHEMKRDFPTTWNALQNAPDIRTAAYLICHNYERPAVENTDQRAKFGQQFYDQFHGSEPTPAPADNDWLQDWIDYLEDEKTRIQAKIDELRGRLS